MLALFGALAAGLFAYYSQYQTNKSNVRLARETMAANQASADRQMRFQEEMSNTAVRRQVADYTAAGFNPLMALPGGADVPGGASATMSAPQIQDPFGGAISSARQAGMAKLDFEKSKADLAYTKSLTNKADVEAKVASKGVPEADIKNRLYDWINDKVDSLGTTAKDFKQRRDLYTEPKKTNIRLH